MDTININGLAGRHTPGYGVNGGTPSRGSAVVVSDSQPAAQSVSEASTLAPQPPSGVADAGLRQQREAEAARKEAEAAEDALSENDAAALAELMRQRNLSFSVDEDSGLSVVKVIDRESGDVIRQMPNEAWVKMARHITEFASGLVSEKA